MNKLDTNNLTNSIKIKEDYSCIANHYTKYYNDIISKLFHEINNPLSLINSTVQFMEAKHPEIKDIKYWHQLTIDVQDFIELLDNFKEYKNCIDVRLSNNNLLELIESVVNCFLPITEKHNIEFTLYISENTNPYFINYPFDKIRIQQVLINIIKNSIEAIDQNGYIKIKCDVDENNLIIEINNNGELISDELKTEIFNPYITKKSTGSGLGLPLSRSIILSHMGDIEINTVGKETRTIITLPKL